MKKIRFYRVMTQKFQVAILSVSSVKSQKLTTQSIKKRFKHFSGFIENVIAGIWFKFQNIDCKMRAKMSVFLRIFNRSQKSEKFF